MSVDHLYNYYRLYYNKRKKKLIFDRAFNNKTKKLFNVKIMNEKQLLLLGASVFIVGVFILAFYFKSQFFKVGYDYARGSSTFTLAQDIRNGDDKYIVFEEKDKLVFVKIEYIHKKDRKLKLNTKQFYYCEQSKYRYSIIKNYQVER